MQGSAVGLGCAMLPLFDFVFASERALFSVPYVNMGQSPEACCSYTFPELLGTIEVSEMLIICSEFEAPSCH